MNAHKGAFYFTLHFTTFLPFLQEQTVDFRTKNSGKGQKYANSGVQHLLHLKSKSKILRPIEIMGFFYEFFCQIQGNNLL